MLPISLWYRSSGQILQFRGNTPETVWPGLLFSALCSVVLIPVDLDYDIILPQHTRLLCWDCLYSITAWWWYLICYPPSSFKKASGLFSAIEMGELLDNGKQNEKFYVFDVEDITSLNTKFSLYCLHSPSLPNMCVCMSISVFIWVFIGLHTYSQGDMQTNIFAYILCKR